MPTNIMFFNLKMSQKICHSFAFIRRDFSFKLRPKLVIKLQYKLHRKIHCWTQLHFLHVYFPPILTGNHKL